MMHVGQILKSARLKTGMSLAEVESKTKIKQQFLRSLEAARWKELPEYAVVVGFVKNLSKLFGLDAAKTLAFLKRDFYPRDEQYSPKPDIKDRVSVGPRLAFLACIVAVIVAIGFYIFYQYTQFGKSPELTVDQPVQNQVIETNVVQVTGNTDPASTLLVDGQPVIVQEDGSFAVELTLETGENKILVKSTSRSGKETIIERDLIINN